MENQMDKVKNDMAKFLFGRERNFKACVICGSEKVNISDFKDHLSWKEFNISCMCQECQDKTFGGEE